MLAVIYYIYSYTYDIYYQWKYARMLLQFYGKSENGVKKGA